MTQFENIGRVGRLERLAVRCYGYYEDCMAAKVATGEETYARRATNARERLDLITLTIAILNAETTNKANMRLAARYYKATLTNQQGRLRIAA